MDLYPENTSVKFTFEVKDASGEPLDEPCNASVRLYDVDGNVLFSGNAEEVSKSFDFVAGKEQNQVPRGQTKDLRRVVVRFVKPLAEGEEEPEFISSEERYYLLYAEAPLTVGENSFTTYDGFLLLAANMPHLDQIAEKTKDEIVVALLEAHDRLMRLKYRLPYSTRMENVGYVSEVAWRPRSITDYNPWGAEYHFSLDEVTPEEFAKLPEDFRKALAKAQVIEANSVLEPTDSIEERRRKGVILETINEVKMMFSNVTPVNQKISRGAMAVLGKYIDTTVQIRRS